MSWYIVLSARQCVSPHRFACNNHTICDEELRPIGLGIFPLAAMVNHACKPTCAQVFDGKRIIFKATRPIAEGEEVTISYVDLAQTYQERRIQLLRTYHFDLNGSGGFSSGPERQYSKVQRQLHVCHSVMDPWSCEERDRSHLCALAMGGCAMVDTEHETPDADEVYVCLWGHTAKHKIEMQEIAEVIATAYKSLRNAEHLLKIKDTAATVKLAQAALVRIDGSLGLHHVLRIRLLLLLLRALVDTEDWEQARATAVALLSAHEICYPQACPPTGLHLALLAKLEAHVGTAHDSRQFAQQAEDALRCTHSERGQLRQELQRIIAEAEMEMLHEQVADARLLALD